MNLKDFYIDENETIIAAVEAIEKNHQRNIFIVNSDKKVIGVLSQGDIIRSIISGTSMYTHCYKICNTSFKFLKERDMEKAYLVFKTLNLSIMPIIDEFFHLVDVIQLKDIYEYLESKVTI